MRGSRTQVVLDGANGEGGGGLIRTALAMSALSEQAVRIENVRAGTPFPGLDVEDIQLASLLATASQANTSELFVGATNLVFEPKRRPTSFNGPVPIPENPDRYPNALVVLSTALPVLARTGAYSVVSALGETYGANSLTYDYFAGVCLYALGKMGIYAGPQLVRAGFTRDSEGEVVLDVEPSAIQGIQWTTRGALQEVRAIFTLAELPRSIGQRGTAHLEKLSHHSGVKLETEIREVESDRPGIFLTIYATYERGAGGVGVMGTKGLRVENLAQMAFDQFVQWVATGATVDSFLCDQLLIPAVLAPEPTIFTVPKLTKRFLTQVWVVKQFAPIRITVRGKEGEPGTVEIKQA